MEVLPVVAASVVTWSTSVMGGCVVVDVFDAMVLPGVVTGNIEVTPGSVGNTFVFRKSIKR